MNLACKLRVVPDRPMPEAPIRPVIYGAAPWGRLPHNPTADEITIRARAQSLMSKGGVRAELPDIATARRVVAEHQQEKAE